MDSFSRYVYVLSRSPKTEGSLYYRREEEVDMMIQRKRNLFVFVAYAFQIPILSLLVLFA